MMVFLVEQSQSEQGFEVARHIVEQALIVEARESVAVESLVGIGAVEKGCQAVGLSVQNACVFVQGVFPLLQLYVPCGLLEPQVGTVGVESQFFGCPGERVAQRLCALCLRRENEAQQGTHEYGMPPRARLK